MFELSLLAFEHKAFERINDGIEALARDMSATELGEARLAATRWRRGGSVLPAHQLACNWVTQLLDISFMMYQTQWHLERKKSILTCWTADSSPLKRFNWMNSGCLVLEADKAVRAWGIVRKLAVPERLHSDEPLIVSVHHLLVEHYEVERVPFQDSRACSIRRLESLACVSDCALPNNK